MSFIDYEKAFDELWRNALWYKLLKYDKKSCVRIDASTSVSFMNNRDVRQGNNLSPILFSVFLNDLEEFMVLDG